MEYGEELQVQASHELRGYKDGEATFKLGQLLCPREGNKTGRIFLGALRLHQSQLYNVVGRS